MCVHHETCTSGGIEIVEQLEAPVGVDRGGYGWTEVDRGGQRGAEVDRSGEHRIKGDIAGSSA